MLSAIRERIPSRSRNNFLPELLPLLPIALAENGFIGKD
jgi:hypothetical protein